MYSKGQFEYQIQEAYFTICEVSFFVNQTGLEPTSHSAINFRVFRRDSA